MTTRNYEITIDGIKFRVHFDRSEYLLPRGWTECPQEWHELARDLAFQRFESEVDSNNLDHVYTAGGVQLLSHFVDSHDDKDNRVEGGRQSGLHFPILGRGSLPSGQSFLSGSMNGQRVVSILA